MSEDSRNKGFINRWSSRKQQAERHRGVADTVQPFPEESVKERDDVREPTTLHGSPVLTPSTSALLAEEHVEIPAESIEIDASERADRVQAEPIDEAPLLSDADMPPIESLSSDSDVSAFFNKGVSAALRKAALRHVFRQPAYNVRDGLNDYDGDYTVFEPLGDTVTSDMKWHIARKERERLEAEARELEQRSLEAENVQQAQEMEEVQGEEEGQTERQAQAREQSQETEGGEAEQGAQAEKQSQEAEDGEAEQEAKTGQQLQETGDGEAEHEAQANHQTQEMEEAQVKLKAQTQQSAKQVQTHNTFDQARQIDADEKDKTRNKPA